MTPIHASWLRLGAVAAAALTCASAAHSQGSPYYIGVSQRLTHQSNLYNAPSAGEVSDVQSSTSLLAGLNLMLGRQRLFADVTASNNRYNDNKQLDHSGYSARVGLDWETIGRLSGSLSASSTRNLADFSPAGFAASTTKNITKTDQVNATARIGVVTRLTGELSLGHRTTRFSEPLQQARENDLDELSVGVRYRPGASLTLGAALRLGMGEYPRFAEPQPGQFVSEGYDRRYVDLTADWPISGASSLSARISLGEDSYDTVKARDFSGATGSLGWRWKPTGKIGLSTTLSRDVGDQGALFAPAEPGLDPSIISINQVRNTLSVAATYEVSAKINATAGVSVSDGKSINPLTNVVGGDRTQALKLGLRWMPTRSITAGCDLGRSSRSASAIASSYDANTFGCYGEFALR